VIPGKKYKSDDVLRILWRYRWAILLPWIAVTAATFGVARALPNKYKSETLILVVPQRVPESYVRSTVTMRIEDRLHSITQQILSRTRLEQIIKEFNLYSEERRTGIMEDVVERMRKDIGIEIVKGDAFRVAYTGDDPRVVMKVTERLASLFIDESLRDREVLAQGTNQFLEAQLEDARRQLVDHEKALEAYRKKYDGQLPTQVDANLQAIRDSEMQLQSTTELLNRDRDEKLLLDRQIADLSAPDAVPAQRASDSSEPPTLSAAQQLDAAKKTLDALQVRFKPEHPDVIRMKRLVHDLEAKAALEAKQPAQPLTPAERVRQNKIAELTTARDNLARAIHAKEADVARLKGIITQAQTRLAAAPTRESELTALTRDYDTLQKTYTSLLAKQQDSQVAENLERRQIGEQFKVLDPARLAEKPFSPNRLLINSVGTLGGLGLGLALVALIEYRDRTLKSDVDVSLALGLPVLASVPLVATRATRLWQRRGAVLSGAAAVVLVAAAVVTWMLRG
jgi:polysaccharide chain length determinant protein (PEP-CTERM system associated)